MEDIINIDPDICTAKVKEALAKSIEQSKMYRYEFITPEILLYNIITQPEFISFCHENDIDHTAMKNELRRYNAIQDKIPEGEEYYGMVSSELIKLFTLLDHEYQETPNEDEEEEVEDEGDDDALSCIGVPEILEQIYELDDESVAKYILCKYLGEDYMAYQLDIFNAYLSDKEEYVTANINIPKIKAEAFINGKKIDLEGLSHEEILQKMVASANRLMGALHSLDQMKEGVGENQEPQRKHEPWEDLVTCLNTTYMQRNPLIGREKELTRCIRILCRKDKNNPLFIGEPGVGKTALIYGLTKMIEEGNVPQWLKGQTVYALDMASLVAGASYHGEFEKRMKLVLEGAKRRGNCILYIDEIHSICDTGGGSQSMNAGEMLKPYLEDGSIRFIGSTTYQEYNKSIANKKALARRFGQIDVKEPSIEETIQIVNGLLPFYEKHHGVKYAKDAVQYAVEQSNALIHDRFLPDKAIDIIDEAGAYLQQSPKLDKNGNPKQARFQSVDKAIIKQILTDVCRIDAKALASESNVDLKNLDKRISQEIYGQENAIKQVVRSVMMSKAGLMEPDKPIASLLFVGPTGVGKTEVCKVLAKELGVELIRFDMSEYTEKHTISKLIGSPAGYVGYDEGGLLTDAIRKTPNCVLLLDEIEKAHTDIYNILLQVMDYAKLTDNKGNKADFRNVILVMTSNAGAQFANQAGIGFGGGQSKGQAMLSSVKKTFKPEFLNRLSGTVVFNDMDKTMATLILEKKLRQLSKRLETKNVTMSLSSEAKDFLLEKGFNAQYGAREMDRVIQQYLTPLLMEEILFGKLAKGGHVTLKKIDDGLAIDR